MGPPRIVVNPGTVCGETLPIGVSIRAISLLEARLKVPDTCIDRRLGCQPQFNEFSEPAQIRP